MNRLWYLRERDPKSKKIYALNYFPRAGCSKINDVVSKHFVNISNVNITKPLLFFVGKMSEFFALRSAKDSNIFPKKKKQQWI